MRFVCLWQWLGKGLQGGCKWSGVPDQDTAHVLPGLSLTLGSLTQQDWLETIALGLGKFHLPGTSPYRQKAKEEMWEVSTDPAPSSRASGSKGLSLELDLEKGLGATPGIQAAVSLDQFPYRLSRTSG